MFPAVHFQLVSAAHWPEILAGCDMWSADFRAWLSTPTCHPEVLFRVSVSWIWRVEVGWPHDPAPRSWVSLPTIQVRWVSLSSHRGATALDWALHLFILRGCVKILPWNSEPGAGGALQRDSVASTQEPVNLGGKHVPTWLSLTFNCNSTISSIMTVGNKPQQY